MTKQQP